MEDRDDMSQQPEAPVSITSARPGRSADIRRRETRYLLSMAVRTICFVLAIIVTGPLRWVLVGGAFFLPYFAVVVANAADGRRGDSPQAIADSGLPKLAPGPVGGREPDPDD